MVNRIENTWRETNCLKKDGKKNFEQPGIIVLFYPHVTTRSIKAAIYVMRLPTYLYRAINIYFFLTTNPIYKLYELIETFGQIFFLRICVRGLQTKS